jgi:hypothetical protein
MDRKEYIRKLIAAAAVTTSMIKEDVWRYLAGFVDVILWAFLSGGFYTIEHIEGFI